MGSAVAKVLGVHAFLVEQGCAKEPSVMYGDMSSALGDSHRRRTLEAHGSSIVGDAVMGCC